jgi:hypothetical protein
MLEFEIQVGGARQTRVIMLRQIAWFGPSGEGTHVKLDDGTDLQAVAPYAMFKQAALTVRNRFVSLVPANTG